MTPSKIFFYFCLSFLGGVFLNSFFQFSQILILGILILATILISVFWKYKNFVILGFCLLFLLGGVFRHQIAELEIIHDELRKYNDLPEKITLIGVVSKEPEIKEKNTKLTIKVESFSFSENNFQEIKGKVLVTTSHYPRYQYGDKLKIKGFLKTPPVFEGFNYKDFLKKEGIYSIMNWPEIELVGRDFGNPVMKTLFSFKNKFQEKCGNFISPPQLGILEALFSGDERNLSEIWKEKLNFTGTRHITAVSGMNITIIGFLIISFALSLGLWRSHALFLTLILLFLYILMIGAPPSAVRAGIMGGLLIIAQSLGRLSSASRAVVFAGSLMVLQNPLILKLDISFQLSFLATLGIIYLVPIFQEWLKKIPNDFQLRTVLAMTLSAQIFTLPILVYNFGYISLVSPFTNILIVPLLPFLTILIFILGISSIIFWPLGYLFSLLTWPFLTYIIKIVDWFSKIPFSHIVFEDVSAIYLLISYLILGILIWRLQEKQKLKFL